MNTEESIQQAVDYIRSSNTILITAGAGISVDSGLPDFRGKDGFWKAYPQFKKQNMSFMDVASAPSFDSNPRQAWGFYGHRTNLYRETIPHKGFELLKAIVDQKNSYFIFTSNVDGQFQKAGFDHQKIIECHGSIHHLQCTLPCLPTTWINESKFETDINSGELTSELPRCIYCESIARPNIYLFDDNQWVHDRNWEQKSRYDKWLEENTSFVVIEVGAGSTLPRVRREGERYNQPVIRINPREYDLGLAEGVSINMNSLEAIENIYNQLNSI